MGPVRLFVDNHLHFFNGLCYAVGIAVIKMEIQSNLRHTHLSAQFLGSCPGSGKVQFISFRWKIPYENGLGCFVFFVQSAFVYFLIFIK